jgi:hypothetical protein
VQQKPRIERVHELRGDGSESDRLALRSVASAPAPATVAALSKSHIRDGWFDPAAG